MPAAQGANLHRHTTTGVIVMHTAAFCLHARVRCRILSQNPDANSGINGNLHWRKIAFELLHLVSHLRVRPFHLRVKLPQRMFCDFHNIVIK